MQLHWVESKDYGMYAEPMASAYVRIVALFLIATAHLSRSVHRWLNADAVAVLHNYQCFRQFSITELLHKLQKDTIELRLEDADTHIRDIARQTFYPHHLAAICGAFDLLALQDAIGEATWQMLHRLANALSLPDSDVDTLITKYFCD